MRDPDGYIIEVGQSSQKMIDLFQSYDECNQGEGEGPPPDKTLQRKVNPLRGLSAAELGCLAYQYFFGVGLKHATINYHLLDKHEHGG